MASNKSSVWCVVKNCNQNILKKRHLFRFPKEHDRWLQWIHACNRLDLQVMGADYAYRNYRLCHLHFEEKWYNIRKTRASLHPDAIPTIFFGRNNSSIKSEEDNSKEDRESRSDTRQPKKEIFLKMIKKENIFENDTQGNTNNDLQLEALLPPEQQAQRATDQQESQINRPTEQQKEIRSDVEMAKASTSSNIQKARKEDSPLEKKLRQQITKLKARVKKLEERNRRLQKKFKNLKNIEKIGKKPEEYETLRHLTCGSSS
ncbi:52 kDa repressor of the inhibitor of the protein kinase-like isoform X2 [Camponotus floridanus]|uniref:52 kDa repressor of the inhibitor of the protein kinase-like isoform X2 n=1 Tax=Camponotus floridanus TaxID=104421 RepID=UPI000DC69CD2|nr:52 kDa repressor of the inhibitor of the protein kinase-like isoform X2 [Camponotus floridanus]